MAEIYHRAAKDGYLDILRNGNRKQMNTADEDGCTPAMLAAAHGNLEALREIIVRGGDVDKTDLFGSTSMHHAARTGQWNCASFLVNFGANIWKLDNDMHTAMDVAAMENRTEIVKILDMAQTEQSRKNPKVVRKLKEDALRDAEKNAAKYEKIQEKAFRDLEKVKRQQDKIDGQMNGDFKAPTKNSFVKTLTKRVKGNTWKNKNGKGGDNVFSTLAGTTAGRSKLPKDGRSQEFRVSEMDGSGNRTVRSIHGTMSRSGGQVLYTKNIDIGEPSDGNSDGTLDRSTRPALTKVFPGAYVNNDSGVESFESGNTEDIDEAPGLFNRPGIGVVSFLSRMDHMSQFKMNGDDNGFGVDEHDALGQNGLDISGDSLDKGNRNSSASADSLGISEYPDQDNEELDALDDDDDDTVYTPVIMFLEGCGLHHYAHLFLEGDVDMDALMMLTSQDFDQMGIPIGPKRKLMDAIQRRRVVLNEPAQMYDSQL